MLLLKGRRRVTVEMDWSARAPPRSSHEPTTRLRFLCKPLLYACVPGTSLQSATETPASWSRVLNRVVDAGVTGAERAP